MLQKTRLGKTELMVTRTSFGALPIQRVELDEAARLVRKAFDAGINFFDTARVYTDSEVKLGKAFEGIKREDVIIASKTMSETYEKAQADIETTLTNLKTDYIDLMQLHNPPTVPDPNDGGSAYAALIEAKKQGKVRHIGITNHRIGVANEAVQSGLFETMQFPFSYLSGEKELALVEACKQADMGFIAMKALSGGLAANIPATFAFIRQYETVVPIYGIQRERELDEFLALDKENPQIDAAMQAAIDKDRKELGSEFCRSCGYCLPCPVDIEIPNAARIYWNVTRGRPEPFLTDEWKAMMRKVDDCIECRACSKRCPYDLDTPALLKKQQKMYFKFCEQYEG